MNENKKGEQKPKEKKSAASSRLGKEAKIGMTVILILFLVFCVVLARRLTARDPDVVAIAAPADADNAGKVSDKGAEQAKPKSELWDDALCKQSGTAPANFKQNAAAPIQTGQDSAAGNDAGDANRYKPSLNRFERANPAKPPESPVSETSSPPQPPQIASETPPADSFSRSESAGLDAARPPEPPNSEVASTAAEPPAMNDPHKRGGDEPVPTAELQANRNLRYSDRADQNSEGQLSLPANTYAGHEWGRARAATVGTQQPNRKERTYVAVDGDTLFKIARYELGKPSRWAEIYDLNRNVLGKDFNHIAPGTQLVLPAEEKADIQARQQDNGYQR